MKQCRSAIVVGGGMIGCSIAYELAKRGVDVTLLDKGPLNKEASTAAAGMLGAHVETHNDGPFFELCKASQRLYRSWTEELFQISGTSAHYIAEGVVRVALTEEDELELRARLPWIGDYEWLSAAGIMALEPSITARVRGGMYFREDHQVYPVHLAQSLRLALERLGCRIKEATPGLRLLIREGSVIGVATSEGVLEADRVIVASGAWSTTLLESAHIHLPIVPVKGQCLALRPTAPITRRTVFTHGCYIVPRTDGTVTIGATQVQAGFDQRPTAAAVSALYTNAIELQPALADSEFVATWTGLRPGTPDGLPYIGTWPDLDGLLVATGHYRNGVLLSPITAKLIGQLVAGETPEVAIDAYAPNRAAAAISR